MSQLITLPPNKFVESIHGTVTRVTRRVEIYESDNATIWKPSTEVGFTEGDVQVDYSRDERRTLNLTLDNTENDMVIHEDGLWYDKVIKVYRGVIASDGTAWETKLGEFLIDDLKDQNFPHSVSVSGRDFTKKLLGDKFATTTTFERGQPVEELIRTIALNGGIANAKMNLPLTGKSTGRDYTFDRTVSRWEAVKQIATDYAFDIYFDQFGVLRLEVFADPYLDEPQYTFQAGVNSNIESFEKSVNDSRLYNHVVVTGGTDDPEHELPPYAVASNVEPTSPTRIAKIGRRSYFYTSEFMTTQAQCQDVANKFLKVHALEQFDVSLNALVIPYLESGITVNFFNPNPSGDEPVKYLLSSFSIPLGLAPMSASVKRIISVG